MYSHIYFSYLPHSYTKDGVFLPLSSSECIPKFAIWPLLASNSWLSSCLSNFRITGMS